MLNVYCTVYRFPQGLFKISGSGFYWQVPLYVIAKGSDIEMLKYYLEKNKDLFPAVDVKDMTSGIMLSEETDGYDALYIVAKGKILNRVVWNVE